MQPLIAQQPTVGMSLKDITSKTNKLPNRYGLHAVEGWGKTSLAAQFPKPIFIQTRGETGLETLIDAGRLPETPHFPEIMSWPDLRQTVRLLGGGGHAHKTLVVDTLNGAQNLCFEDVCRRQFSNDRDKFVSFGRGPAVAAEEWRAFLQELDEVRQKQKMIIFCLVHTKVTKFKNPEGSDFDRYQPELDGSVAKAELRKRGDSELIDRWADGDSTPFIGVALAGWGMGQTPKDDGPSVYEERGLVTL